VSALLVASSATRSESDAGVKPERQDGCGRLHLAYPRPPFENRAGECGPTKTSPACWTRWNRRASGPRRWVALLDHCVRWGSFRKGRGPRRPPVSKRRLATLRPLAGAAQVEVLAAAPVARQTVAARAEIVSRWPRQHIQLYDMVPIMDRRTFTFGLGSIALGSPSLGVAQPYIRRPPGWNIVPTITVLFREDHDPRLPLVRDAAAFWNDIFSELATKFRLGGLTDVRGVIPVEDLKMLSTNGRATCS